jgi:hypothetical protein
MTTQTARYDNESRLRAKITGSCRLWLQIAPKIVTARIAKKSVDPLAESVQGGLSDNGRGYGP